MNDKRLSRRTRCKEKSSLQFNGTNYHCQLENISMSGALVTLKGSFHEPVYPGDICVLSIALDNGKNMCRLVAQVIHYGFAFVGLKYTELDNSLKNALETIIDASLANPLLKDGAVLSAHEASPVSR